jgi:uncharacterized repeat protein (TIGR04002 family)
VKHLQKLQSSQTAEKMRLIAAAAVFAAVITVTTAFIKIPMFNGFIHIGDTVIFLAAAILPAPLAAAASGIGAGAADLIAGYPIYIPATVIIKALMTLPFQAKGKVICKRNIIGCIVAAIIGIVGYFLFELIMYGRGAFLSIPGNILQESASMAWFILIGLGIDKNKLSKHFIKK